jgi:hypothetical protein
MNAAQLEQYARAKRAVEAELAMAGGEDAAVVEKIDAHLCAYLAERGDEATRRRALHRLCARVVPLIFREMRDHFGLSEQAFQRAQWPDECARYVERFNCYSRRMIEESVAARAV